MKDQHAIKKNRAGSILALASLALMLCGYASQSRAQCVLGEGIDKNVITLNFGPVVVPPNAPVSRTSPIADKRFPVSHKGTILIDCRKSNIDGSRNGSIHMGTQLATDSIFRTNIPGIGIRIGFRMWESDGTQYFPHISKMGKGSYGTSTSANWVIHAQLFKIAPTTGNGSLEEGLYATMYSSHEPGKALQVRISGRSTSIVTPSCTAAPTPPVQLGKVWKNLFSSVGSTAAEQRFNITLNCLEAKPELNAVYLRMDAKPDASGAPGVIALSPDANAATGVGIQILDKNRQPVTYGQSNLVGMSKNATYNLPFYARYYQTANQVTAGLANGSATFTLEYK
ncbi:type 1 fimbrial protein [Achromobacter pestifer]|uniref:Type 1 fimbrial protein n=1 Tax=Achromobacter pestifer TaxID=1353889 RepID=A0A7D4HRM5_9BURK|nr:fimbrial protein [Achromobacter pestifer]QKH36237.1 type 1 fimbrial protein [Achromobacter pestifer]